MISTATSASESVPIYNSGNTLINGRKTICFYLCYFNGQKDHLLLIYISWQIICFVYFLKVDLCTCFFFQVSYLHFTFIRDNVFIYFNLLLFSIFPPCFLTLVLFWRTSVSHSSTNQAQPCLASETRWDWTCSGGLSADSLISEFCECITLYSY